jgi:sugar lactone lactonase YvrE
MTLELEQVTPPVAYHAEGPVWFAGWGGLRWVDMFAGDVLSLDGATGAVARTHIGDVAGAIRPRSGGGMVAGVERGFVLIDETGIGHRTPELWPIGPARMNDGGCDPHGRFYCGAYSSEAGGADLWRLDPDGTATLVLPGVTASNGLAWSPDGTQVYYVDTATREISVFDYEADSGLTDRRTFVAVDPDLGKPDGLTVDAEGGVWVALYGGAAVHRYDQAGTLDAVIRLAESQTTACTFGGDDLGDLYITTSREKIAADAQPNAGSVFRARPGVRGLPVLTFAG